MTRSDDDPLPPLAVALTALRVRASCRQSRLADELGISGTRLSLFENGHRDLKRERLEELLAPLGWGPEDIDFTLFWYDALSPEALDGIEPPGSPFGLDEAERRAFRHVATAAGRAGFSAALAAAARNRRRALSRQARVRARAAWKRLSRSLGEERRWLVERAEEYRDFALCDLLCEESERAAARDASQAIELAELALHIAERVPGSDTWRARLQGYAWAFLANALRVDNDLDAADLAFAVARALWESGAEADSGVLDPSRILDLEASLRRARDMPYDTALATLDLVILLLEENENAEAQTLALEMVAVFKRLAVYREALAAVHLFRRAAEQEAATAELGRRLLRFLERARYDPELRFEMALQGRRTTSR